VPAPRPAAWIVPALLVAMATLSAQTLSIRTAGGHLGVRASGFAFLTGPAAARLKDGRSVRVELALHVLTGPGRPAAATARRAFALSYDLWEERFAVTTVDSPPRTVSHLTSAAAEAWCIEQLAVPIAALGSVRGELWLRLESRVLEPDDAAASDDGGTFTLQGLIEVFSRRRKADSTTLAVERGPFRLPGGGGRSRPSR
jgi:hypothetical protein